MKGEASFGEHKILMDFNRWCTLEDVTGLKVPSLLQQMQHGLGFHDLRTYVRVFLSVEMSEEEVGDLLGAVGYKPALTALNAATEGFFSTPKKAKSPNPRAAE